MLNTLYVNNIVSLSLVSTVTIDKKERDPAFAQVHEGGCCRQGRWKSVVPILGYRGQESQVN